LNPWGSRLCPDDLFERQIDPDIYAARAIVRGLDCKKVCHV
jgi:hypothetical protein